jgi:hypothetical protein
LAAVGERVAQRRRRLIPSSQAAGLADGERVTHIVHNVTVENLDPRPGVGIALTSSFFGKEFKE